MSLQLLWWGGLAAMKGITNYTLIANTAALGMILSSCATTNRNTIIISGGSLPVERDGRLGGCLSQIGRRSNG